MDKDEDFGGGRAFGEGADDVGVGDDVGLEFAGFNVEDEDQDCDVAEDVISLMRQIVFDKAILPIYSLDPCLLTARLHPHIICIRCVCLARKECTHPPQSQRFSIKFPINLILLCSTSIVAPNLLTSFAT